MTRGKVPIPGYWRFLWMFFMQPVLLYFYLRASGIEKPDDSGWRLWRSGETTKFYVKRSAVILMTSSLLIAAALLLSLKMLGLEIDVGYALLGIVVGIVTGITIGSIVDVPLALLCHIRVSLLPPVG